MSYVNSQWLLYKPSFKAYSRLPSICVTKCREQNINQNNYHTIVHIIKSVGYCRTSDRFELKVKIILDSHDIILFQIKSNVSIHKARYTSNKMRSSYEMNTDLILLFSNKQTNKGNVKAKQIGHEKHVSPGLRFFLSTFIFNVNLGLFMGPNHPKFKILLHFSVLV